MAEKTANNNTDTAHENLISLLRSMHIAGGGIRNETFVSNLAKWVAKKDPRPIEEIKSDIRGIIGAGAQPEKETMDSS